MKKPQVFHYKNDNIIDFVHYEKSIIIPREPVIANTKQREKTIKKIEALVRKSMEYKDFISYLRTYVDMNHCEFFPNITGEKKKGMIQIHHEPFNMFRLCATVLTKHEDLYDKVNVQKVAEEVMRLHYQGMVGLIPVSVTAHQLADAGKLPIPLNVVYGRFVQFIQMYYDWIDPMDLMIVDEKMKITENMTPEDLSILKVRYLYSEVDGQDKLRPLDENGVPIPEEDDIKIAV